MNEVRRGANETPRNVDQELERFSDQQGGVVVGLIAERVLYVRFHGYLSQNVGEHYARSLLAILSSGSNLKMFKDCSELTGCDLLARSANVRCMLEHRRKLAALVVLTGPSGLTLSNHHLDSILDRSIEYTTDLAVFEARLAAVAKVPRLQSGPSTRRRPMP